MKKLVVFLLVGFSLLFAEGNNKVINIGVENINYYPHYSTDKGEYFGFARDILDAFAQDKGYTIKYHPLPIKRLFMAFTTGKLDLKYPDNPYWGGDSKKGVKVIYSDPVVSYTDGVMVKPENKDKGLKNFKTLGTVLGFTAYEYLNDIKSGKIMLSENPSFTGVLKQAIYKKIDGAYINTDVGKYALDELLKEPGVLVFDPSLPHTTDYYCLSTIKRPKLLKEFNQWLASNKEKVSKIKAKFKLSN